MCLAVWWPNPQLQYGGNIESISAWKRKTLKPFLQVHSCTAKKVSGFCRSWWSARTSLPVGASMEVKGAGLLADACHLLCLDY